jgi:hypothetical protein
VKSQILSRSSRGNLGKPSMVLSEAVLFDEELLEVGSSFDGGKQLLIDVAMFATTTAALSATWHDTRDLKHLLTFIGR